MLTCTFILGSEDCLTLHLFDIIQRTVTIMYANKLLIMSPIDLRVHTIYYKMWRNA
jgi:hypothetical protein